MKASELREKTQAELQDALKKAEQDLANLG